MKSRLGGIPWHVLLVVAALIAVGIVFLRSSTTGTPLAGLWVRQLKALGIGLPVFLAAALLPTRLLRRFAGSGYILALLLLLLVLLVGVEINYSRRWFAMPGGFLLQPSEFAKVAYLLLLARHLERHGPPERWRDWLVPGLLLAGPFLLVRAQPDLGTALMFLPLLAVAAFVAGAARSHYVLGFAAVAVLAPAVYFSPLLQDYQKERIRTFLTSIPRQTEVMIAARRSGEHEKALRIQKELELLKRNAGFQSHAGLVAIGSGGLYGKGLGRGPQNRLNYLPERHSDFIFAVIAEEWGLVGAGAVVLLYLLLAVMLILVAGRCPHRFGQLVIVGITTSIVFQAFCNIAMCCGVMPITGMPLPFLSQGGSSMMACLAQVGLVVGLSRSGRSLDPFSHRSGVSRDPFGARDAVPTRDHYRASPVG